MGGKFIRLESSMTQLTIADSVEASQLQKLKSGIEQVKAIKLKIKAAKSGKSSSEKRVK